MQAEKQFSCQWISAEVSLNPFFFSYKETTQIEDPRKQWRQEQERMLKDYLMVAQDALRTQKELYHVKEQRLALALDEYVRLNDAYKEKSSSRTSCKYSREYNVTSLICALQGIPFLFRMRFQGLPGTPCTLAFLEIASLLFFYLCNINIFCWREPSFL